MKKKQTFAKLMMLVVMAILPLTFFGQNKNKRPAERYFYIQADGGLSINHGDLANYQGGIWNDFNHWKQTFPDWNAHLGIGYQMGKVIGLNLKGGYGLLSGHKHGITPNSNIKQALVLHGDETNVLYDLGFEKTNYIEANLNLTFNLFNLFNYNPRRVVNLVPHVGIGGVFYQAGAVYQVNEDDSKGNQIADKAEKREITFAVPVGMEFTFNVAPKFDIFLDYTYNFTGSDKLDQVAKIKTDEDKLVINDKDMYSQVNFGLRYKFNNPCDIEKMARDSKKITYRVNPDPLVKGDDGNVCFDVIVNIPGEYFEKQAVMNLKPYLAYNGGQIDIDPITFVGEKVKGEGDFRVNYKEGGEFTKHYCIPYQPEMENCELMADPMFYVYEGTIYPTQDEIVKNTYFTTGATEKLADGVIVKHKDEYVDEVVTDTINGTRPVKKLTYFFNKDKYNINDRRKLNNEADAAFKALLNEGVTEFEIKAWASPEGEEGHNQELSNNRDNAAENQMKKLAKKTEINITGKGYGEDWNTFMELVRNSDLKDKDAIINNINNSSNKERTIKEMCAIYPQLEKDILPQLRRAEVYVNEPYQEVVTKTIKVKKN